MGRPWDVSSWITRDLMGIWDYEPSILYCGASQSLSFMRHIENVTWVASWYIYGNGCYL